MKFWAVLLILLVCIIVGELVWWAVNE